MLIMENSEEVLQILERFTKLKSKDIPKELDEYLNYVAKTGDTVYRWANIKYLVREKLVHVIKDFHENTPGIDDLPQYPNVDPFNYETMKSALLERLDLFNAAPFTVQRLCELLTSPRKQYSRIDKYMRALEKNILVVSTIEPGRRQPESENGDSLDSVVNGDISLDVNVDIDMENETIFRMETQNNPPASSSNKVDTHSPSAPKKLKLTTEENSSDKTKFGSDSDESSNDSDTQCSKENAKVDQLENVKEEQPEDKSTDSEEAKLTEKFDTDKVVNVEIPEKDLIPQEENATDNKENENAVENVISDTKNATEEISETNVQVPEKKQEESEKESASNKDSTVHPVVESTSELDTALKENTEERLKKDESAEIQCSEEQSENSSNTSSNNEKSVATETVHRHSEIIQLPGKLEKKNPEQMAMEEILVSPIEVNVQAIEHNIPAVLEQSSSDQPMDEQLETEIPLNCPLESPCINEVVMQTESEIPSDSIKMLEDKVELTGMDVDDTSQEEAMDQ